MEVLVLWKCVLFKCTEMHKVATTGRWNVSMMVLGVHICFRRLVSRTGRQILWNGLQLEETTSCVGHDRDLECA